MTIEFNGTPITNVDEALNAIIAIERQFDLCSVCYTPDDVRDHYETIYERPMSDEQWVAFRNSWYWRKGLGDSMSEQGWETIGYGMDDVFDADGNIRPEVA